MIEFTCFNCGKKLRVRDEAAGKRGHCPQCETVIQVPQAPSRRTEATPISAARSSDTHRMTERTPVEYMPAPAGPALEAGHVPQALSVNVHLPRRTSSLGVVSLILGGLAFILCWIPLVGIATIPLSVIGFLLAAAGAIVSLRRGSTGIGYPVGGAAVCGLALAIGVSQVIVVGAAADAASEAMGELSSTSNVRSPNTAAPALAGNGRSASPRATASPAASGDVEPEWPSAKRPVRFGDIQVALPVVNVAKVVVGSPIDRKRSLSRDDHLIVFVQIENLSKTKKIHYESWQGGSISLVRDYATLEDNYGNTYKRIDFGFDADVAGHVERDSIYPGKTLGDVLVFEQPVDTVKYLNLELPARNVGGDGMIRVRIPADMIQRR